MGEIKLKSERLVLTQKFHIPLSLLGKETQGMFINLKIFLCKTRVISTLRYGITEKRFQKK
jgi:hypothetical protein